MTDLGTVGGLNSSAPFPVKDDRGLVVGQSQGSQIDQLGEYWGVAYVCNTSDGHCTGWQNLQFGFVWRNGVMTALPTLGGNNSSAFGVNNRGQVVGFAETGAKDPSRRRRNSWSSMLSSTGQGARCNNNCSRLRATTSRRLSGSMTTATWWACREHVGPPIPPHWAFTPWFGETAQSPISPAWEGR